MTVYLDILISVDLVIDCFMLIAAARLSGRRCSRPRLCLGSAAGALSSLIILAPPLPFILSALYTVLVAAAMTLITFGKGTVRSFVRTALCLLLVTLCYGGIMNTLWLYAAPHGLTLNNGAVYLDIQPMTLIMAAVVFYLLSLLFARLRQRTGLKRDCRITVVMSGVSVTLDAILDTGDLLTEPFSGLPVVVAERAALRSAIPEGFDTMYNVQCTMYNDSHCSLPDRYDTADVLPKGFRVIPYSALGGEGLLMGFKPESLCVHLPDGRTQSVDAWVGITDRPLGDGCRAIINPNAVTDI